jgi:hypothetical protein
MIKFVFQCPFATEENKCVFLAKSVFLFLSIIIMVAVVV